jgi:hypothetical protein
VEPFALYAAFPRADYYGSADFLPVHPRIFGGVATSLLPLSFASLEGAPVFTMMDSSKTLEVVVISQPVPATAGSSVDAG